MFRIIEDVILSFIAVLTVGAAFLLKDVKISIDKT